MRWPTPRRRIGISKRARRPVPRSFCLPEILLQVVSVVGTAHDELVRIETQEVADLADEELAVAECDEGQLVVLDAHDRAVRAAHHLELDGRVGRPELAER